MKKKIIIYSIIALLIFGVVYLRITSQYKKRFVSVKTTIAAKGEVDSYLSTTGTITSQNSESYYGIQGKIKKINVNIGDKVSKGQVLVTFETQDLNAAVQQAQVQYNNAVLSKQDLVSQNNTINSKAADLDNQIAAIDSQIAALSGSKNPSDAAQIADLQKTEQSLKTTRSSLTPISDQKLAEADNAITLAQISLNTAKDNLAKNSDTITADIDGVVTALNGATGAMNSGAQPVVVVQDVNNLKLQVSVSKYDANKVKLGQQAVINSGDKQYKGTVTFINPAAEKTVTSTGTDTSLGIEITVLDKGTDLKIGFDTDVDILLGKVDNVIKVPAECIKTDKTGNNFVYVVQGNKASEKAVSLGLQSDTDVEVTSGIKEGDKVILNPGISVQDGTLVK